MTLVADQKNKTQKANHKESVFWMTVEIKLSSLQRGAAELFTVISEHLLSSCQAAQVQDSFI